MFESNILMVFFFCVKKKNRAFAGIFLGLSEIAFLAIFGEKKIAKK